MKSFDEIRNTNSSNLNEKYLRKGAGIIFANKARSHGMKAEQYFKKANSYLEYKTTNMKQEEQINNIVLALSELSKGLIEIRHQNGANTSLALTGVITSQKSR